MVKIEINKETQTDEYCSFILRNTDISIANALRRIMLAEVPTMAINEVNIITNTTCCHNEFINQRLGLIPLISYDVDKFKFPNDCDCNGIGCVKCTVSFEIDINNTSDKVIYATVKDIIHIKNEHETENSVMPLLSNEDNYDQDYEKEIVLLKIGENQQLKLQCHAVKGIGKRNSKWNPTCTVSYQIQSKITIDKNIMYGTTIENLEKVKNSCPTNVFKIDNTLDIEDANKCMFCNECINMSNSLKINGLVNVEMDTTTFNFVIESNGSLKAIDILKSAIKELSNKLNKLKTSINNID